MKRNTWNIAGAMRLIVSVSLRRDGPRMDARVAVGASEVRIAGMYVALLVVTFREIHRPVESQHIRLKAAPLTMPVEQAMPADLYLVAAIG